LFVKKKFWKGRGREKARGERSERLDGKTSKQRALMPWLRGEKEEGDLRKGIFPLGLVYNAISQRIENKFIYEVKHFS
jgi:hypothetical protein